MQEWQLVERLSTLLKDRKMMLATAESCTGGLLAAAITSRPGASAVFDRGFITYSNEAKMDMLGVSEATLKKFGAVSAQTAEAMAKGAITHSRAKISASITGIAGPDGGSPGKPVGLIYFGYALKGGSAGSVECRFCGSRDDIRSATVNMALSHLIEVLEPSA